MKHILRRVTALVMCAVLCVIPMQFSPVTAATTDQPLMAYVPLDNRPVCVDRPIYEAESAGFDIELPPADSYKTLLDGQGGTGGEVNGASGWQHGDGATIMTWLEEMEAKGCDHYVIHLDQILSGGLVGSRYPDSASAGINAEEKALLKRLDAIVDKQVNGVYENKVYFVETVMRLASTGYYKGFTVDEHYNGFRSYAEKARKDVNVADYNVMTWQGAIDCIDAIYYNYPYAADGSTISYSSALTSSLVQLYHNARRRKLDMLYDAIGRFENNQTAVYIFGVDDASPTNTIQTDEIEFIHALMSGYGHDYYLSADTDSSGLMAIARCVNDYYNDYPAMKAVYFGNQIDVAADGFDIGTLRQNIKTHVESLGCVYIDDKNNTTATAEVEVLVLTKPDTNFTSNGTGVEDQTYTANIKALISRAKSNIANNVPTIIIDASTDTYYGSAWVKGWTNLQDELVTQLDITRLFGYSNWNTVGNSIGIALGNGMARYTYVANADAPTMSAHSAFLQTMTHAYIKDITYVARNKRADFTWLYKYWFLYDSEAAGWNNNNFYSEMWSYNTKDYKEDWELCAGEHYLNNELEWKTMNAGGTEFVKTCGNTIMEKINNGTYYRQLNDNACVIGNVGTVTVDRFRFPWYRLFEMTFDINVKHDYFTVDAAASLIKDVAVKQDVATFVSYAKADLSADSVTIADWDNAIVADDAYVGTGYTVTTVSGGNSSSYQIVIKGDVSGDGLINTNDVRDVLRHMVGLETFDKAVKAREEAANVDNDNSGNITSIDARRMLQMALQQY